MPVWVFLVVVGCTFIAQVGVLMIVARQIEREQSQRRHDLRNEVHILVNESEHRLEQRIERVEQASYGFRRRVLLGSDGGPVR